MTAAATVTHPSIQVCSCSIGPPGWPSQSPAGRRDFPLPFPAPPPRCRTVGAPLLPAAAHPPTRRRRSPHPRAEAAHPHPRRCRSRTAATCGWTAPVGIFPGGGEGQGRRPHGWIRRRRLIRRRARQEKAVGRGDAGPGRRCSVRLGASSFLFPATSHDGSRCCLAFRWAGRRSA